MGLDRSDCAGGSYDRRLVNWRFTRLFPGVESGIAKYDRQTPEWVTVSLPRAIPLTVRTGRDLASNFRIAAAQSTGRGWACLPGLHRLFTFLACQRIGHIPPGPPTPNTDSIMNSSTLRPQIVYWGATVAQKPDRATGCGRSRRRRPDRVPIQSEAATPRRAERGIADGSC